MTEVRVGVRVADDRQSATVEIGPVGGPSSPVGLNLEQLSKVIGLLGQARSRMVEGTPKQPLEGRKIDTVLDPPWYVKVADADSALLAFDHTFFGPVAFVLPKETAARIVQILSVYLAIPDDQNGRPN